MLPFSSYIYFCNFNVSELSIENSANETIIWSKIIGQFFYMSKEISMNYSFAPDMLRPAVIYNLQQLFTVCKVMS